MATLKGRLDFHIDRAENLPDTDNALFNIFVKDVTDPYVLAEICNEGAPNYELFRTNYIKNDLNPVWDTKYNIDIKKHVEHLTIQIRDKEKIGSARVAAVNFTGLEIFKGHKIEDWFTLKNEEGQDSGRIRLSVQFFSTDED